MSDKVVATVPFLNIYFFSVRSVMQRYMEKQGELVFDKIFNQRLGK